MARFAAVTNSDGQARGGDRARAWSGWWSRACATRAFFWRRGHEAAARGARRRPRRGHLPPGPRQLPGQGRAHRRASCDAMGAEMGILTQARARGGARGRARWPRPTSPRPWSASSRSCRASWAGSTCSAQGDRRRTWPRPCAGTTTRSRSRRGSAPAGVLAGGDGTVFAAVSAGRQARHAGRLLRPRPAVPRAAAIPSACGAPARARCACSSTSGRPTAPERRPSLRALAAAVVAGYGGALQAARRRGRPRPRGLPPRSASLRPRRRAGFPADEVEAVLGAREPDALDDPRECAGRASQALHRVAPRRREDFERLAVAFKRAKNILGRHGARGRRARAASASAPSASCTRPSRTLRDADGGYDAAAALAAPACARPWTASSTTCS